jgi:PQQ-like domain
LRLFAAILFASAALCQAAESAAGRWEGAAHIPGAIFSPPLGMDGAVFFRSTDGNLHAID